MDWYSLMYLWAIIQIIFSQASGVCPVQFPGLAQIHALSDLFVFKGADPLIQCWSNYCTNLLVPTHWSNVGVKFAAVN